MTTEQSDGACTPSFSSAELERTAFERWYSNDGQWSNGIERSGDGYKYQGADHAWRVWQVAVKFEREACKAACRDVAERYPTEIFPEDGQSLDCKSARMARLTAANCEREIDIRSNA